MTGRGVRGNWCPHARAPLSRALGHGTQRRGTQERLGLEHLGQRKLFHFPRLDGVAGWTSRPVPSSCRDNGDASLGGGRKTLTRVCSKDPARYAKPPRKQHQPSLRKSRGGRLWEHRMKSRVPVQLRRAAPIRSTVRRTFSAICRA